MQPEREERARYHEFDPLCENVQQNRAGRLCQQCSEWAAVFTRALAESMEPGIDAPAEPPAGD